MSVPRISMSRLAISFKIDEQVINGDKPCGFLLTKSKWDPYPWIGHVENGSIADVAGLKTGDCLLQIDQIDVVGLRVKEIASLMKQAGRASITFHVWRNDTNNNDGEKSQVSNEGIALHGPLPILIKKFLRALTNIMTTLDCPICLETAIPPISQCVHGHILCAQCRAKSFRCPVCRVKLGQGRCLIADEVQQNIKEAFQDETLFKYENNSDQSNTPAVNISLKQKLFGRVANLKSSTRRIIDKHTTNTINSNNNMKKNKLRFSHIIGGFERAISADNLTKIYQNVTDNAQSCPANESLTFNAYRKFEELTVADRAKSASTSELCESERTINYKRLNRPKVEQHSSVVSLKSWGGSIESLTTYDLIQCPVVVMHQNCMEPIHRDSLLEHLARAHNYSTQINIHQSTGIILMATLMDPNSIYIFHSDQHLYILQYQNEVIWITGTCKKIRKWSLRTYWNSTRTEFNTQRNILTIDDINMRDKFSSCSVQLPTAHAIESLYIEILSAHSADELSL